MRMHFPKMALHAGCFRCAGGIASARMHRERKIAKDQPHAWMVFFYQLIEKRGKSGTGRALEVGRTLSNVTGASRCHECERIQSEI